MEFCWEITSRTGEQYKGTDEFPSTEQKDSANLFNLTLSNDCLIQAPYGQEIFGNGISITVPDDSFLVFKRRVKMLIGADLVERENKNYTYIIAFEKKVNQ